MEIARHCGGWCVDIHVCINLKQANNMRYTLSFFIYKQCESKYQSTVKLLLKSLNPVCLHMG